MKVVHSLNIEDDLQKKQVIVPAEVADGNTEVYVPESDLDRNIHGLNYDVIYQSDKDMINTYRKLSITEYVDYAIQDIVNEAIVVDGENPTIKLNIDALVDDKVISEKIKLKILDAFDDVLKLLNFDEEGEELFRKWYVDGRMYVYVFIDKKDLAKKNGISEIRIMDPRYTKKYTQVGVDADGFESSRESFYIYFNPVKQSKYGVTENAIKIPYDSVVYADSGLYDLDGNVLSYLHKSIKAFNQLNDMEEAMIIFRIARAPQRRIFYLSVDGLPRTAANQALASAMRKYKNKLVYDVVTGKMSDSGHIKSVLDDIWLTRRDGKGTEVDTLAGAGSTLGEIDDIELLKKKLYKSLSVPSSRLSDEETFSLGRPGEISRDEVKLARLITKLRNRFVSLLRGLLKIQCVKLGIVTKEEFENIYNDLKFIFNKDTRFAELAEMEILNDRIDLADKMIRLDGMVSKRYIYKKALKFTDDEIDDMLKELTDEPKSDDDRSY